MYVVYGKARYVFGTWNNAISAAGYKPNPVMFARHHIASDGHRCDSLAEKIIETRKALGGFKSIKDLKKVKGIGDKKFEKIREMVAVD